MTDFPYKPGDKIRDRFAADGYFVHVVALGDESFIGVIEGGTEESLYRKNRDWERYVEPEPPKQFTIETEYRIPRLGDDLVLLHGGIPRLGHVGGGSTIYVGPHWVVTKITERFDGPATTIWRPDGGGWGGGSGRVVGVDEPMRWTAGGMGSGPGATI